MTVQMVAITGDFAEDKDAAAKIREEDIRSAVVLKRPVTLDFTGVSLVTQSFIHALVSDVLRTKGEEGLKYIIFKGCNKGVKGIVETVVQYSLETMEEDDQATKD